MMHCYTRHITLQNMKTIRALVVILVTCFGSENSLNPGNLLTPFELTFGINKNCKDIWDKLQHHYAMINQKGNGQKNLKNGKSIPN